MVKKKFTFAVILLFMSFAGIYAQQKAANINFNKLTHDFGKIQEADGKVTYKFEFTNTGNKPLVINDVKASCGCTSNSWTRKPVMPGEEGFLSATFDPAHRPGNFNKSILVRTNAENSNILLRIRGEVIPREKSLSDKYPKSMGDLRLKSNHLPFVTVKNTEKKVDSLEIMNTSNKIMDVTFERVPDYLTLKTKPDKLMPGQKGYIWGKLDGTQVDDWGFLVKRVVVKVNGEHVSNGNLAYSAKIVEDFSHLSPRERANAARVKFENTTFDFGNAEQKEDITHYFKFTNVGESDLKIRKIRATCGCTTVKPDKTVIKPGETSSFKTIFHTGNRRGPQRKTVYFISNDPENPITRLTIKGNVKK